MLFGVGSWHQQGNILPDKFIRVIAEQGLHRRVDLQHHPLMVDGGNHIRHRMQYGLQRFSVFLLLTQSVVVIAGHLLPCPESAYKYSPRASLPLLIGGVVRQIC